MNKQESLKRVLSVTAAAVCMITAIKLTPFSEDIVSAESQLTALQITENMEIGWNVGNSLDSTGATEMSWGNPRVTQELIDAVKAKGFNTIRIPTTWFQHLDGENNINADWLARVKEVVDYAYNQDMYVIINVHHESWINRADFATAYDEMSPKLIKIWEQIGAYFSDYGQRLIFEGMNEPREVGTSIEWTGNAACYEVVNKLNADFVKTVRAIDSPYQDTRLLMVPSYCASAYDYVYSNLDVPDDDFIAVSLHAYAPYNFCMNPTVPQSAHDTFTDAYRADLDSLFNNMRSYFTDKDIPVVLGEFSASNYKNTEARCEWAEYYITAAKKVGIPCVLWDNNAYNNTTDPAEDHSYINRTTYEWYAESEPVVDAMMKVINDDSIVWGSERKVPVYSHPDIDSGSNFYKNATGAKIDASVPNGNCTANYDMSLAMLEGKDVAVKFTGTTPSLAMMDGAWGNWTEVNPYEVDKENGIAYYSYDDIKKMWSATTSPEHLCFRTTGQTTIYQISLIDKATLEIVDPAEPTVENSSIAFNKSEPTEVSFKFKLNDSKLSTITDAKGNVLTKDVDYTISNDVCTFSESYLASLTDGANAFIAYFTPHGFTLELTVNVSSAADEFLAGDANCDGDVDMGDAVAILKYLADPVGCALTEQGKDNGDVCNRGDKLDSSDALSIQKLRAKQLTSLPESYLKGLRTA